MNLQEIRERRNAVESVRDVVSAMRATAAGRIQAAQRAMLAARRYRDVVLDGLAAIGPNALELLPSPASDRILLVVFTSEQPLCGAFNHLVIDRALALHKELGQTRDVELVSVGHRGGRAIAARGVAPHQTERGATSVAGIRDLVRRLSSRADHGFATGELAAVDVVYARYRSVSEQQPTVERVLPLDRSIVPPSSRINGVFRYLEAPLLVAGLVSQFAYISFFHAAAESFASEQASRLVAMDGATRNSNRMVQQLLDLERRERQHEITRQIQELNAGRELGE